MAKHEGDGASGPRKATNVSLDIALVDEAKGLGINISRACEAGLARQIADEQGRRWRTENEGALDGANAWVEANGLPLAKYRQY